MRQLMGWLVNAFADRLAIVLLAGGMVALYIASRAAVDALVRRSDAAPGRRAVGHWMPIAVVALFATATGHSDLALGVLFATSVAVLALVGGLVGIASPAQRLEMPTPLVRAAGQRAWLFLLPASLLTFMAGYAGHLTWFHAITLGLEGLVIWSIWLDPPQTPLPPTDPAEEHPQPPAARRSMLRMVQLLLAIAVAAVGAWALVHGATIGVRQVPRATEGLLAAAVLGPILILPIIGPCLALGTGGRVWAATGTQVGVALLNLCVLLPLVVGVWYATPAVKGLFQASRQVAAATTQPARPRAAAPPTTAAAAQPAREDFTAAAALTRAAAAAAAQARPLTFPLGIWRLDNVLLIVLGFILLPVALGRWTMGRGESVALLLGYGFYIVINAMVAVGVI
jgi:Ca2+/Na+ antiporter